MLFWNQKVQNSPGKCMIEKPTALHIHSNIFKNYAALRYYDAIKIATDRLKRPKYAVLCQFWHIKPPFYQEKFNGVCPFLKVEVLRKSLQN